MICWTCLSKSNACCDRHHGNNATVRANRFFALVAGALADPQMSEVCAIEAAQITMQQIALRVESGKLFGEVGRDGAEGEAR